MTEFVSRIQVGQQFPHIEELSVRLDDNDPPAVNDFDTTTLLNKGVQVIFLFPGACTPKCSRFIPAIIQAQGTFDKLDKVFVKYLVPNDRDVAYDWAIKHGAQPDRMIPDWNGDITKALGLGVDKGIAKKPNEKSRHLGIIPERACIITVQSAKGPIVIDVMVEPNMSQTTDATTPSGVLKRLPDVIKTGQEILAKMAKKKTTDKKEEKIEKKEEKNIKNDDSLNKKKEIEKSSEKIKTNIITILTPPDKYAYTEEEEAARESHLTGEFRVNDRRLVLINGYRKIQVWSGLGWFHEGFTGLSRP